MEFLLGNQVWDMGLIGILVWDSGFGFRVATKVRDSYLGFRLEIQV